MINGMSCVIKSIFPVKPEIIAARFKLFEERTYKI